MKKKQKEATTHIRIIQYNQKTFSEEAVESMQAIRPLLKEGVMNWVQVEGTDNYEWIHHIADEFGLNITNTRGIFTTQHIIFMEEYDDVAFVALPVIYATKKEEKTKRLAFILGRNFLVSFQNESNPLLEAVYTELKNKSLHARNKRAGFLLALILERVISKYAENIDRMEDELEELEDRLLDTSKQTENYNIEIQEKRREVIHLRRLLTPFKEPFAKLLRADSEIISEEEKLFFKHTYDQLLYLLMQIEACKEITVSLVDLYLNNNSLKMNMVMKRLTIVSTIFIPLTFLVGVWGMNFKYMPELEWEHGYFVAWSFMVTIAGVVWLVLRKK